MCSWARQFVLALQLTARSKAWPKATAVLYWVSYFYLLEPGNQASAYSNLRTESFSS